MKNYWLVKTEEDVYPIEALKQDGETLWGGVRNYQARNFLLGMKKGDLVFIYHSNTKIIGITGLAEVTKEAIPDPEQFNKKSDYFDEKSTKEKPRWFAPTLKFKTSFNNRVTLDILKNIPSMKKSALIKAGNRLSVMPLDEEQASQIIRLSKN